MPLLAKEVLPISSKDILSWCFENRSAFPQDKPIYADCADPRRSISAGQAYKLVRRLVAGLRAFGIKKGDCVCVHAFNDIYYPVLVQGIVGAGAVFVGTNPGYTDFELQHALKVSHAKLIITEDELVGTLLKAGRDVDISPSQVLLFADQDQSPLRSWRSLLQHGEQDWVSFDDENLSKSTTAFLMFSSGTTGLPKAAQVTHHNLIAQHTILYDNPRHPEAFEDRRIYPMPAFHIATAGVLHFSPLRAGFASFVMRRFELEPWLENTEKFGVTLMVLAPPLVVATLALARQKPNFVRHCLRNVKRAVCGAAPLDRTTQLEFQKFLPVDCPCTQGWGMTEASGVGSFFYYPESDETGSVGRWLPNIDTKLVDDHGLEVGPYNARGELCIRGPTVIKGYLDNPEANRRDWDSDGFFHTGDVLYGDEKSGRFYVVDRKKELIKVRAFQVAPSEIEGVLLLHPQIVDAAVIGVPNGNGELPKAFVVLSAGSKVLEEDLKAWVASRLSKYKHLEGGVQFVDAVPKSPSGKILKRQLRDEEVSRRREAKL
ncbi:hypothetical protein M409DRAFT_19016 [Zasmidium cellare ATCC 36951]|uniref:Acetyl-CoA synthetase-like protein n=1 Tax=Zasmidium cellare ATCC 36951 TaxID=1080233 RepID=A0A6A6CWF0_ZASCE|nr:uncharacterized protein M409DRAFT_19016 [Zasmidium cellare ATCC 36951]KAF2171043.1 hypothetical protein M409DRAFT_19016 [Zasmidium cellare ATCC 36951]